MTTFEELQELKTTKRYKSNMEVEDHKAIRFDVMEKNCLGGFVDVQVNNIGDG